MIAWGINALNHGSSLAVFRDTDFYTSTSTEDRVPSEHIRHALERYGAPDRIFWYEQPWKKKLRQLYAGQYSTAFDLSNLPSRHLKSWGLDYAPITYTPHHASHAAAGYYTSPFNHCAVVVLDAIGEFECATIWEGMHGELRKVWSTTYPNSLGLFYSAFTQLCGLTPIRDEHLLQKMAEQGDPAKWYPVVNGYFGTNGPLDIKYNFHRGVNNWAHAIDTLQTQCDIAAAVQRVFEEHVHVIMANAKGFIGTDCLVYMGGCAMNSQANQRYVEPMFKYRWSLPNPGDASSAIGAVLYHTKQRLGTHRWDTVNHLEINV